MSIGFVEIGRAKKVLALLGVSAAGAVRLHQPKVARAEFKAWELHLGHAPSASKPAPQPQALRGRLWARC